MKRDLITGRLVKMTTNEFILKARAIHGDQYDYSQTNYVDSKTKVVIICRDHGKFKQLPSWHLSQRHGCPFCGLKRTHHSNKYTRQEWIDKANRIHNFKFDYSKSVYTNGKEKIIIRCPTHGDFSQTLESHFQGRGCPKCFLSKGEGVIEKWLESKGIKFIFQMEFDDCRNPKTNRKLKFDFYIPDQRILIEFDGVQHFKELSTGRFVVTSERLQKTKLRDQLKTDYAAVRGIRLVRISYKEFSRIHQILEGVL